MAIGKNKIRLAISLHKETKELMNSLLSLHREGFTYSNLIEKALCFYADVIQKELDQINEESKKEQN